MFSQEEQVAILTLLDSVIKADGDIHIKEADYLEEVISSLSLEMKNLKLIGNITFDEASQIVKQMVAEKKMIVINCLSAVSESDDVVDESEKQLITEIEKLIK